VALGTSGATTIPQIVPSAVKQKSVPYYPPNVGTLSYVISWSVSRYTETGIEHLLKKVRRRPSGIKLVDTRLSLAVTVAGQELILSQPITLF
jgi:hypothetical protein